MTSFRVERSLIADSEFLNLPRVIRESFIGAFHALEDAREPVVAGRDWFVEPLRQRKLAFPEGLYSLHVGPIYRGLFIRSESNLRFIAFGPHLSNDDVYRKLTRARRELAGASGED